MFLSSYVVVGDALRYLLALLLGGLVAVGALSAGVYGVQCAVARPRARRAAARRERQITREAREGIAALEAYLDRAIR
jgi:hypothetical protein